MVTSEEPEDEAPSIEGKLNFYLMEPAGTREETSPVEHVSTPQQFGNPMATQAVDPLSPRPLTTAVAGDPIASPEEGPTEKVQGKGGAEKNGKSRRSPERGRGKVVHKQEEEPRAEKKLQAQSEPKMRLAQVPVQDNGRTAPLKEGEGCSWVCKEGGTNLAGSNSDRSVYIASSSSHAF